MLTISSVTLENLLTKASFKVFLIGKSDLDLDFEIRISDFPIKHEIKKRILSYGLLQAKFVFGFHVLLGNPKPGFQLIQIQNSQSITLLSEFAYENIFSKKA